MTTNTGGAISQKAFEDAGLCSVGQTITSSQLTRGLDRLNDIINMEATQGLKLWLNEIISVPLVASQATYRIGPSGPAVVMTKPLQILQAYYLPTTGSRTPLNVLAYADYIRLSNTTTTGAINSYFVDKQAAFFDVSFWNVPDATVATGTVGLLSRISAPNVVADTDGVQFPPEWTIYLRWALADEVCTGQSQAIQERCSSKAMYYRSILEGFDVEDAPVYFQPDQRSQYYQGNFR